MKIGILGTRGIPNTYGGFEQFAEYLSLGLVKKNHKVYVYNSSTHPYQENTWKGVHLIHCKDWEDKIGTAGQFIYDYHCIRDARKRDFDVLLQLGYTSNSIWHKWWPANILNMVNMDGLEWKRSKYSRPVQYFLKQAEKWAATKADVLISDSTGIQEYLLRKYNRSSFYIPYGAEIPEDYDSTIPGQWGLRAADYSLLIARMEPENNIEMVLKGWIASRRTRPLVIVGNHKNRFGQFLVKKYKHEKLRFAGPVYDQAAVNSLRHYSALYLHGHSVGGTNPSLLEAMACGCTIAAHNNIFNRAVLNEDAMYFCSPEEVRDIFDAKPDPETVQACKERNREKIRTRYNWDDIIDAYEKLFKTERAGKKISRSFLTPV